MSPRHLLPVALSLVLASCAAPSRARTVPVPGGGAGLAATVTHVVDGDTVDLRLAGEPERARLLGIDTPETVKPDAPVDCFGPEASARTKALLPAGTAVVVQRDREARDRYGRLLVYLWRRKDHLFVNGSLVSDGYARTLSISPNTTRQADLAARAGAARAAGAGLWATCPPDG
ncbi:thermonuclease family protein [Aquihabitans daechungensis]|uniref:thermonuclease family protein n=1 Tax=Aquihabitans daechungensis TaxID=1052257 RepID=UPI003BA0EAAC